MGNCAASSLAGECASDADPLAVCRDRKRLIKAAAERRRALVAAHAAYAAALREVAASLDAFVARHTSPAPTLIALPTPAPSPPASPKPATPAPAPAADDAQPVDSGYPYYYASPTPTPTPPAAPAAGGWDFFNPFYGAEEAAAAAISEQEMRVVRERKGIPELEEAEEGQKKAMEAEAPRPEFCVGVVKQEEAKEVGKGKDGAMEVAVAQPGRELLAALKEVEELFARAAEAGKEVTAMLETTGCVAELKENSSKIVHAITWHWSPSSVSISYRSELGASSNSLSSMETRSETKREIFDEYGGMKSGSHSQTLGRLCAWEKKLYEEVKAIDQIRHTYEKKRLHLRNQDTKSSELRCAGKTRTAVRDLYTRTWVSLRAAESISERIQKLRDEELQPQLIELLQGFLRAWKIMAGSHETQRQIMFEVNSFTCPEYSKFCSDAQRHATLKLEAELSNWRSCFVSYVCAQKAYVEALDGWLSKFILTDAICYSQGISFAPDKTGAPPLVVICHDWYTTLPKLPSKLVSCTMRSFARSVRVLWLKQGEEQQQKKRVDGLAKEIDRKISAYKRAENKLIEIKLLDHKPEQDAKHLSEKKETLDTLRKRLEVEKGKHRARMRATHDVTLNGFKIGLAGIFESLAEFSKDYLKLYEGLLTHHNSKDSERLPRHTDDGPCMPFQDPVPVIGSSETCI